jgi:hypothetical protein
MKLSQLIIGKTPVQLHHPVIGFVEWGIAKTHKGEELGYWGLYFAQGPEKYDLLVCDESVLLDDSWQIDYGEFK